MVNKLNLKKKPLILKYLRRYFQSVRIYGNLLKMSAVEKAIGHWNNSRLNLSMASENNWTFTAFFGIFRNLLKTLQWYKATFENWRNTVVMGQTFEKLFPVPVVHVYRHVAKLLCNNFSWNVTRKLVEGTD